MCEPVKDDAAHVEDADDGDDDDDDDDEDSDMRV